jgi:hypothetical protein
VRRTSRSSRCRRVRFAMSSGSSTLLDAVACSCWRIAAYFHEIYAINCSCTQTHIVVEAACGMNEVGAEVARARHRRPQNGPPAETPAVILPSFLHIDNDTRRPHLQPHLQHGPSSRRGQGERGDARPAHAGTRRLDAAAATVPALDAMRDGREPVGEGPVRLELGPDLPDRYLQGRQRRVRLHPLG